MKAHLAAIKADLSAEAATFVGWADPLTPTPYFVISAPAHGRGEGSVRGDAPLAVDVRVKAVAGTTDGVLELLALAKARRASVNDGPVSLSVEGRYATTHFVRSEFVAPDQSSTTTETNRHRVVGVDTYRLISQPL